MILPDSEAFVAKKIAFYPTGDGQVIALDAAGGACVLLDGPQAEIVEALSLPADTSTLESRLMQLGWDTSFFSDISSSLRELCQMGLISPIKDLTAAELQIDVQRYPYLAWPTKNKPQELMRGLKAWELFYRDGDLKPGFIISDDSDNPDNITKTAIDSLGISGTSDVHFLDREARRRFPDAFPAELRESMNFALGFHDDPASKFGAYGANQNFILLLTAGLPVAMTDDDMLPKFMRRHEHQSDTTALFSGIDPTAVDVVKNWTDYQAIGAPAGREEYLRSLKGETSGPDVSLANMQAIKNAYSEECHVAALCFCCWGDPGSGNASYLLANRGQINVDISDSDDYRHMMENRLIFRAPRVRTLGGKTFMSGHSVYYPKPFVPPFSPLSRNQDGCWGLMLEKLQPESRILYSDLAIKHDPIVAKVSNPERAIEWYLGLNETLSLLAGLLDTTSKPSHDQIISMGKGVESFSTGSIHFIRETLSDLVLQSILGKKRLLLSSLQEFGEQPEWWAEDVYAAIHHLDRYMSEPGFWLPKEYRESEKDFIAYCRNFGLLLQSWPEIYELSEKHGRDMLAQNKL